MRPRRLIFSSLGLALGLAQLPLGAVSAAPVAGPTAAASWTAYATSGLGLVTPIDTATNRPGAAVKVAGSAGAIAITPNGRTAYVVTDLGVVPFDTATRTPGAPIAVGTSSFTSSIAITPDGSTVYVTSAAGTVVPISTTTNRAGKPVKIGARAAGIAITPDGSTAYVVGDFDPGTVVPIDLGTRIAGRPILVGNVPRGIAVTPDGGTVYVANTGQVWPIDTVTNTTGKPIVVGDLLFNIAISPDGSTAFVTDDRHQEVTPVDLVAGRAGTAIPGGFDGVAITPDGHSAYATSEQGILPIDVANNTVGAPIPVPANSIAISPDQAPDAEFTVRRGRHGSLTRLDGSLSVARSGRIASYGWRFGDGTRASTNTPVIGHVYARPGRYTATLTVTDSAGTSTKRVFTGQTMSRFGGPSANKQHMVLIL